MSTMNTEQEYSGQMESQKPRTLLMPRVLKNLK